MVINFLDGEVESRQEIIDNVACSKCLAEQGQDCLSGGLPTKYLHYARRKAYREKMRQLSAGVRELQGPAEKPVGLIREARIERMQSVLRMALYLMGEDQNRLINRLAEVLVEYDLDEQWLDRSNAARSGDQG